MIRIITDLSIFFILFIKKILSDKLNYFQFSQ